MPALKRRHGSILVEQNRDRAGVVEADGLAISGFVTMVVTRGIGRSRHTVTPLVHQCRQTQL